MRQLDVLQPSHVMPRQLVMTNSNALRGSKRSVERAQCELCIVKYVWSSQDSVEDTFSSSLFTTKVERSETNGVNDLRV
jgi:hypothetical protein